ncbi:MAG: MerR family transcriptional regulator [Alphaproteobacteria bacterium]
MTQIHSSARTAERPRRPQKSPQAFRTISEVSEELDVPAHVLRFWESRFAQVRPLKRGGGRRYYRPGDVALLKGIRRLLYSEGMTIKGAQKVMRERGVRFVAGLGTGDPEAALLPATAQAEEGDAQNGARDGKNSKNGAEDRDMPGSRNGHPAMPKPLLTPEKRANLEAALSVLSDLRAELSEFANGEHSRENAGAEPA